MPLRPFRPDDCRRLFDWRNHPEHRRWSFSAAELRWEDHQAWFGRLLANPRRQGFMLEVDGEAVGQIRFDGCVLPGSVLISFAVAPDHGGRGHGRTLVAEGVRQPWVTGASALVLAETFVENVPSNRIFERLGFVRFTPAARDGHEFLLWALPLGRDLAAATFAVRGPEPGSTRVAGILRRLGVGCVTVPDTGFRGPVVYPVERSEDRFPGPEDGPGAARAGLAGPLGGPPSSPDPGPAGGSPPLPGLPTGAMVVLDPEGTAVLEFHPPPIPGVAAVLPRADFPQNVLEAAAMLVWSGAGDKEKP